MTRPAMQMRVESRLTPEAGRVVFFNMSAPLSVASYFQNIPAAFVGVCIASFGLVSSWIAPHSARMWYDPELQYMLSSLSWFRGRGYVFIDHPGTPVEVLGTLFLAVTYPFLHAANEAFVTHYLKSPQDFFNLAQSFLVCATVIVALLVARWSVPVRTWSGALIGAAIAALFFIVMPQHSLRVLSSWTHESFNFPAGTLVSLATLVAIRRTGGLSWRGVLGLGFASGLLTSIQLYFSAWAIGTVVAVGIESRLRAASGKQVATRMGGAGVMAGVGFVIGTWPIHDQYRTFLRWIILVASHQGTYGMGETGAPDPVAMLANLVALADMDRLLFIVCAAGLAFLGCRLWVTRRTRSTQPVLWAAGLGLTAQLLVLLLMNAKHRGYFDHYMLPVAATLPMMIAASLEGLNLWPTVIQRSLAVLGLLALVSFGYTIESAVFAYPLESAWLDRVDTATENMLVTLAEERQVPRGDLRVLWTYGTGSPCYALWWGDESTAGRTFHDDIAQLCPRDNYLDLWEDLAQHNDWDVAVLTDGLEAQLFPAKLPPTARTYKSSIDTVRFIGKLVFVTPN